MTVAVAQLIQSSASSGTAHSTLAASITISAGSWVHVDASWGTTGSTATVSDGTSNLTQRGSTVSSTPSNEDLAQWSRYYPSGGTLTFTITISVASFSLVLGLREITGTSGAGAFDGANQRGQTTVTTTADAVTSNVVSNTTQPGLLVACSLDNQIGAPAAGTGFTSDGTGWDFNGNAGGTLFARFESKRLTSTAGTAATFTAQSTSSDMLTQASFYTEAGGGAGGGGPPVTRPRQISDEQTPEVLLRRPWLPVSGAAAAVSRPFPRRMLEESAPRDEPIQRKGSVFPVVDSPPGVGYETSDLESAFADEGPQRRRAIPTSGAVVAQVPAKPRALIDEPLPADTIQEREGPAPLTSAAPQAPAPLTRRAFTEALPDDDRQPRRAAPPAAPVVVAAVPFAPRRALLDEPPIVDTIVEREGPAPLTSAAPQAPAPLRRPALVGLDEAPPPDTLIEREGPAPLTSSAPQAPVPFRRSALVGLDEAPAAEMLTSREGPAPTTSAAPQAPPPPARPRTPVEDQPQDERQRRVQVPASGVAPSAPPVLRARPVSDEQSPETLVRRPWLPVSGVAPSAPPIARARAISDELATEQPQRRPFAPDFARVDAPPVVRSRVASEDSPAEQLPRRAAAPPAPAAPVTVQPMVRARPVADEPAADDRVALRASPLATLAPQAPPPLLARRSLSDEQSPEAPIRRAWLPASAPPPSPPPVTRARPISDEQFPEALQRKPWSPFFWRVDPPPANRARPIAEDSSPAEQTFLDSIWRRVRSVAAFFGIAPTAPITRAAPEYCAPLVDLTARQFAAPLVDVTSQQFTAAQVDCRS